MRDVAAVRADRLRHAKRLIQRQHARALANAPAVTDEPRWQPGERQQILERLGVS